MTRKVQAMKVQIVLCIFFGMLAGCAAPDTPVAPLPTPTVAPGWERLLHEGQCSYVIDFPADMESASQGEYSWILNSTAPEPVPNFIYISVIPDDFQSSEPGVIYNYDPAEAQTLLNMQAGEQRELRADPTVAPWFTYTRLPDTLLGAQPAQTYENEQPWEFPLGTREVRYYLRGNGCTYLVGGYMATVGSGQPGWIGEEAFDEIVATFRLTP